MNAKNNELMVEERRWRALGPAELRGIEGGSPSWSLPPPSAFVLAFAFPTESLSFTFQTVSWIYVQQTSTITSAPAW